VLQVEARLANLPPVPNRHGGLASGRIISAASCRCSDHGRLMPAKYVRPYSKGQKNDFRDTEAVRRPTMKFVAATAEQLDLQALHRVRERLVSQHTGVINQIRAFLLERSVAENSATRGATTFSLATLVFESRSSQRLSLVRY
jgi:transposase